MKHRLRYLAIALAVIPVGLLSRSLRGEADRSSPIQFIASYLPDTLWAVMFFFLFAALLVRWRTLAIATLTLAWTLGIETLQFYEGEPLTTLRSAAPIRFLLGTQFLWSDVICLCVGTALSAFLHHLIHPKNQTNNA